MNEEERKKASRVVSAVALLRWKGGYTEEEIAAKAEFESVGHMRWQLEKWSLPEWLVCENLPAEEPPSTPTADTVRRTRSSGPAKQLPSANNAAPLFHERLEALGRATEGLKDRKEKLQGGQFIQSSVNTDPVYLSRGPMSEEQWRSVQEALGLSPDAKEAMHFGGATWSIGAGSVAPAEPLPALIGAYLLAGGEVESLVQALHPDPPSVDWEKIRKRISDRKSPTTENGIVAIAQQLARLIRGGEVGKGRGPGELPNHEVNLASRITELREQGWVGEDIYQKIRQMPNTFAQGLSWGEFRRLANLELRFPWS